MTIWTAVTEKLPEEYTPVLVCMDNKTMFIAQHEGLDKGKDWSIAKVYAEDGILFPVYSYLLMEDCIKTKVVSWTPLPVIPEELL